MGEISLKYNSIRRPAIAGGAKAYVIPPFPQTVDIPTHCEIWPGTPAV